MALKWFAGNRITGLAADTKPTTVATDSEFLETDTKKRFIWSGSAWVQSGLGGTIEGTEIAANTIPLSKLATGTPNRTIGFNESGNPAELASTSGTAGESAVMNYANKKYSVISTGYDDSTVPNDGTREYASDDATGITNQDDWENDGLHWGSGNDSAGKGYSTCVGADTRYRKRCFPHAKLQFSFQGDRDVGNNANSNWAHTGQNAYVTSGSLHCQANNSTSVVDISSLYGTGDDDGSVTKRIDIHNWCLRWTMRPIDVETGGDVGVGLSNLPQTTHINSTQLFCGVIYRAASSSNHSTGTSQFRNCWSHAGQTPTSFNNSDDDNAGSTSSGGTKRYGWESASNNDVVMYCEMQREGDYIYWRRYAEEDYRTCWNEWTMNEANNYFMDQDGDDGDNDRQLRYIKVSGNNGGANMEVRIDDMQFWQGDALAPAAASASPNASDTPANHDIPMMINSDPWACASQPTYERMDQSNKYSQRRWQDQCTWKRRPTLGKNNNNADNLCIGHEKTTDEMIDAIGVYMGGGHAMKYNRYNNNNRSGSERDFGYRMHSMSVYLWKEGLPTGNLRMVCYQSGVNDYRGRSSNTIDVSTLASLSGSTTHNGTSTTDPTNATKCTFYFEGHTVRGSENYVIELEAPTKMHPRITVPHYEGTSGTPARVHIACRITDSANDDQRSNSYNSSHATGDEVPNVGWSSTNKYRDPSGLHNKPEESMAWFYKRQSSDHTAGEPNMTYTGATNTSGHYWWERGSNQSFGYRSPYVEWKFLEPWISDEEVGPYIRCYVGEDRERFSKQETYREEYQRWNDSFDENKTYTYEWGTSYQYQPGETTAWYQTDGSSVSEGSNQRGRFWDKGELFRAGTSGTKQSSLDTFAGDSYNSGQKYRIFEHSQTNMFNVYRQVDFLTHKHRTIAIRMKWDYGSLHFFGNMHTGTSFQSSHQQDRNAEQGYDEFDHLYNDDWQELAYEEGINNTSPKERVMIVSGHFRYLRMYHRTDRCGARDSEWYYHYYIDTPRRYVSHIDITPYKRYMTATNLLIQKWNDDFKEISTEPTWTTVRTIAVADLTDMESNIIRLPLNDTTCYRIKVPDSEGTKRISLNGVRVKYVSKDDISTKHGHQAISATDATLQLSGEA